MLIIEYIYFFQLVEAYATMIECCQLFDFKSLANYYLEKAMSRYVHVVLCMYCKLHSKI